MSSENKCQLSPEVRLVFATPDVDSSFFGYYDKSPLDASGTRLLAHRCPFDGRDPTAGDEADVGYYSLPDGAWHPVGRTAAFNWQQGAMLQWLGPDFQNRIICNVRRENRFVSVVFDLAAGTARELDFPVYAVHPGGAFALGVNFERFFFFRGGYNYQGIIRPEWNVPLHPDDGIFHVDIATGRSRLLIPTTAAAGFLARNPTGEMHWLEHMMWNPSGSRFLFLHRHGNGDQFTTELFSADQDGGNLHRFPGADLYSHAGWRGDHEFVIFAARRNRVYQAYLQQGRKNAVWSRPIRAAVQWARQHLLSPRDFKRMTHGFYYLLHDRSDDCRQVGAECLRDDGHPTWTRDGRFMLTDTYADESGYRHLRIYNDQTGRLHDLGRFFSPYNCCGFRCDLHPRFSCDERQVIIDSAHTGRRQMLVLAIDRNALV